MTDPTPIKPEDRPAAPPDRMLQFFAFEHLP